MNEQKTRLRNAGFVTFFFSGICAISSGVVVSLLQEQYKAAPEVTRKRLWLETVQEVLTQNRKVVGGDGRQLIYVPMDGQASTGNAPASAAVPAAAVPVVEAATEEAGAARPGRQPRGTEGR